MKNRFVSIFQLSFSIPQKYCSRKQENQNLTEYGSDRRGTGKIGIDNKTYKMDHAEQFIEQMTEILAKPSDQQEK